MTISDGGEHVPGAVAAARGLLVRQLAWRILAAQFAGDRLQNSETVIAVVEAGVTMPEVNIEAAELRRIYGLDDMAPSDGLDVICAIRLARRPARPGSHRRIDRGRDTLTGSSGRPYPNVYPNQAQNSLKSAHVRCRSIGTNLVAAHRFTD